MLRRTAPRPCAGAGHGLAIASGLSLPQTWQAPLEEAAAAHGIDSKLWIAQDHLEPFFGTHPSLMRKPPSPPSKRAALVSLPLEGALQLHERGFTPFWAFSPAQRKRLLNDFPLPSDATGAFRRVVPQVTASFSRYQGTSVTPTGSGAAATADQSDDTGGTAASVDDDRGRQEWVAGSARPNVCVPRMLLLRDGDGWVELPPEEALLAGLLAADPRANQGLLYDDTTSTGGDTLPKLATVPAAHLFVDGDLAPIDIDRPAHVNLFSVQQLPRSSTSLSLDPTLRPRIATFRVEPVAPPSEQAPGEPHQLTAGGWLQRSVSFEDLPTPSAIEASRMRDERQFISMRWTPATKYHLALARLRRRPGLSPEFGQLSVRDMKPLRVVPACDLPPVLRRRLVTLSPEYTKVETPDTTAFVHIHKTFAASVSKPLLTRAQGLQPGLYASHEQVAAATTKLSVEDGGLLFYPVDFLLRSFTYDRETEDFRDRLRQGECAAVLTLPYSARVILANMDCIEPVDIESAAVTPATGGDAVVDEPESTSQPVDSSNDSAPSVAHHTPETPPPPRVLNIAESLASAGDTTDEEADAVRVSPEQTTNHVAPAHDATAVRASDVVYPVRASDVVYPAAATEAPRPDAASPVALDLESMDNILNQMSIARSRPAAAGAGEGRTDVQQPPSGTPATPALQHAAARTTEPEPASDRRVTAVDPFDADEPSFDQADATPHPGWRDLLRSEQGQPAAMPKADPLLNGLRADRGWTDNRAYAEPVFE